MIRRATSGSWLGLLGFSLGVGVSLGLAQDDLEDLGLDELLSEVGVETKAQEKARVHFGKGSVSSQLFVFPKDRGGAGRDHRWLLQSKLEVDVDLPKGWSARIEPRFVLDPQDSPTRRTRPLEANLQWANSDWELRLGILQENWGIADTSNPLDLVPRRDISLDLLEPERLGETGLRVRRFLKSRGAWGEPTLSFYLLSDLRDIPPPSARSRLSEGGTTAALSSALRPEGSDQVLYGMRAQATWSNPKFRADVQAVVAKGPERSPGFVLNQAGFSVGYYGARTLGFGIRAVPEAKYFGRWAAETTWKLEVAYKDLYTLSGGLAQAPESYLAYTVGFDHPRSDVFRPKDQLTFMVEYAGEAGAKDLNHHLRLFTDDLVLRWFWEANDRVRRSVEFRAIYDLERSEAILQAIYEQQLRHLHRNLKVQLDLRRILADGSPPGLLGLLPDPSAIRLGLVYEF